VGGRGVPGVLEFVFHGDILNENCRIAIIFTTKNSIIKYYATLSTASPPTPRSSRSLRVGLRRAIAVKFYMRMVRGGGREQALNIADGCF